MLFVCLLNIFTQYKHLVLFFSSAKMHLKIEGRLSTNREMFSRATYFCFVCHYLSAIRVS